MVLVKNVNVFNVENAIRGARNPMNSWAKGDTVDEIIGKEDLALAQRLISADHPSHYKFLRQIFVSIDILAPRYWWSEMDTYKVGTTANSTSTMHKLLSKPITLSDFSIDDSSNPLVGIYISYLEEQRKRAIFTKNPDHWLHLIQMLPSSYNQLRTWTANYEVLRNIYFSRRNHKLKEWHTFCEMIEMLPYGKQLICYEKEK